MNIKTLIIGFVPLTDTTGKKPRQIRDDTYFKEFLANYDLGEVHFAPFNHWKEVIKELDPLFVIMIGGGDYYAREVQEYKNDQPEDGVCAGWAPGIDRWSKSGSLPHAVPSWSHRPPHRSHRCRPSGMILRNCSD